MNMEVELIKVSLLTSEYVCFMFADYKAQLQKRN